jgi:hypothetical protein
LWSCFTTRASALSTVLKMSGTSSF